MLTMESQRLLIPWSAKLGLLHHKKQEKPGLQTPGRMNKNAALPLNQRECSYQGVLKPMFDCLRQVES